MAPASAQSSRQSAQGTLAVQAVVQGSVALVNVEGEWKLIMANAPDPVESHGSLRAAPQERSPGADTRNHSGPRKQQDS